MKHPFSKKDIWLCPVFCGLPHTHAWPFYTDGCFHKQPADGQQPLLSTKLRGIVYRICRLPTRLLKEADSACAKATLFIYSKVCTNTNQITYLTLVKLCLVTIWQSLYGGQASKNGLRSESQQKAWNWGCAWARNVTDLQRNFSLPALTTW